MEQQTVEHSFDRDDLQCKYDDLRAEGKTPDVAAMQAIRNEYKRLNKQAKALEEQTDSLKEQAEEIAGGKDFDLPEGKFKMMSGSGKSVDEAMKDEFPTIWDKFVNEYEYSYARFY